MKGKFITLEGIEGVGKSTHINFIQNTLSEAGILNLISTREPGGTPIAEAIRQVWLAHYEEGMTIEADLLLLFASRAQHVQHLIKPNLEKGVWVLCDRYVDASYAYQGGGRGVALDLITQLDHWICQRCEPDLTLLFDAPVSLALARIKNRKADRIEVENEDFFERVRECYLMRSKQYSKRYRLIDASQSMDEVQKQLHAVLLEFMGSYP